MVDRNLISKLGLSRDKLDKEVEQMFTEEDNQLLQKVVEQKVEDLVPGSILAGRIVTQIGSNVIVEVGLKSEGVVDADEFDDPDQIEAGAEIDVLLEEVDSEGGVILLSKRKADRIKGWETIVQTKSEGDIVIGKVTRRIKGGLLIDIGVPVFLPASQVDIRKPGDISRFIGKDIECKILKIDKEGHNIVVSRRKLIEEERQSSKEKILTEIEVGQLLKGVVKNIADFGVFVDLGGLDGLLHISDLSWGRISHPSEVVRMEQEIECTVIGVDKENEKISLGLKQKTSNPWEDVEERYPIDSKVKGKVVNIMNYGVFIRLEDGIEGLVHISEMSWTRRISHPADILDLGDEVEVVVLDVNKEKQEISLGMKQTETNPWMIASQKYPTGTIVNVKVRSLTNYGIFVEIEPGIDGLIHISDLSWTKKFSHPNEVAKKGEEVKCVVLEVDEQKQRISLGIKQLTEDPWAHVIPDTYIPGQIVKGTVTKLTNFGVFIELENDLEGLLHISELADRRIENPQDIVTPGQEVEVKILRVDTDARKIGLSLRRVRWAAEEEQDKKPSDQPSLEQSDKTQEQIATDEPILSDLGIVLGSGQSKEQTEAVIENPVDTSTETTQADDAQDETVEAVVAEAEAVQQVDDVQPQAAQSDDMQPEVVQADETQVEAPEPDVSKAVDRESDSQPIEQDQADDKAEKIDEDDKKDGTEEKQS